MISRHPLDPRGVARLLETRRSGLVGLEGREGLGRRSLLRGAAGVAVASAVLRAGRPAPAGAVDASEVLQVFVVLVKGLQLLLEAVQIAHKIEDEVYKMFDPKDPIVDKKHLVSAIEDALKGSTPPEAIAVGFNLRDQPQTIAVNYLRSAPLGLTEVALDQAGREGLRAFAHAKTQVSFTVNEDLPRLSFAAYPIRSPGTPLVRQDRHVTVGEIQGSDRFDVALLKVI